MLIFFGGYMKDVKVNINNNLIDIVVNKNIETERIKHFLKDYVLYESLEEKLKVGMYQFVKVGTYELAIINTIEDFIVLEVNNCFRFLRVSKRTHDYSFFNGYYVATNYSVSDIRYKAYIEMMYLVERIEKVTKNMKIDLNTAFITDIIRIANFKKIDEVISDGVISLCIKKFKLKDLPTNSFDIVRQDTYEVVGGIEFNLFEDKDEFSYSGNVSYEIYENHKHNGYATRALNLLKVYVSGLETDHDKTLYISTIPSNIYSQKVAISNGGVLYRDIDVPKKDALNFIGKVNHVLIYKIDNI